MNWNQTKSLFSFIFIHLFYWFDTIYFFVNGIKSRHFTIYLIVSNHKLNKGIPCHCIQSPASLSLLVKRLRGANLKEEGGEWVGMPNDTGNSNATVIYCCWMKMVGKRWQPFGWEKRRKMRWCLGNYAQFTLLQAHEWCGDSLENENMSKDLRTSQKKNQPVKPSWQVQKS